MASSYDSVHVVTPAEQEWFASFGYPNWVTKICVPPHVLDRNRFLDIGCGPDPSVATYVLESGGEYWGVDQREDSLYNLSIALDSKFAHVRDRFKILGDRAENLHLCPDRSISFVHMRFLLRHLDSPARALALKEASRVCCLGGYIVVIELNWGSMQTSHKPSLELLQQFKETSFEFMFVLPVDPNLGACLAPMIEEALPWKSFRIERFHRPEGAFGHELVMLARMLAKIAPEYSQAKGFESRFNSLADEIQARGQDFRFEPPDIYAAIIKNG
jgi:ubiquinone/menaquinone biosynthesis C-methylase UbiE